MIKTQIIKEDNKPFAVIIDYNEYLKLKELRQDIIDYGNAVEIKRTNRKWTTHTELKKILDV